MSPRGLRATRRGPFQGPQTGRFAACALLAACGLGGEAAVAAGPPTTAAAAAAAARPATHEPAFRDTAAAKVDRQPAVVAATGARSSWTNWATWSALQATLAGFAGPFEVVDASDKWARDVSMQLGTNASGKLALLVTIPAHQTVSVNVPGSSALRLGTFTSLPPTVFTQWHFNTTGRLKPYVGAGLNLTATMRHRIAIDDGAGGARRLELDSDVVSPALQAGVDLALARRWSATFDVRKIWIDSNVVAPDEGKVGSAVIDPAQYSLRMNYRF